MERNIICGTLIDRPSHIQDTANFLDPVIKIAGDCSHCSKKEVTQGMIIQSIPNFETMLEQFDQYRFRIRKCGNDIADVSWSGNVQFIPQFSGTPAVIGNCNDGDEIDR